MSLLLNIDTAIDSASVCLSNEEVIIQLAGNKKQGNHAAWLHDCIAGIIKQNGYALNQLEAVAVCIGPGSYTGLRVGLAAAKGLCFALQIPLITVNSLEVIAYAVKEEAENLICPMIDARRMEAFTAVYDKSLTEIIPAQALIVDENSFSQQLASGPILFCGNGSTKLRLLITNDNASYSSTVSNASHLAALALNHFRNKEFADLAYTEPLYIKEFYSPDRKS